MKTQPPRDAKLSSRPVADGGGKDQGKKMATEKSVGRVRPRAVAGHGAFQRAAKFLSEVRVELRKANWPSRQEVIAQTQVVLALLVVIGVYLFAWDFILGQIVRLLLALLGVRPAA